MQASRLSIQSGPRKGHGDPMGYQTHPWGKSVMGGGVNRWDQEEGV